VIFLQIPKNQTKFIKKYYSGHKTVASISHLPLFISFHSVTFLELLVNRSAAQTASKIPEPKRLPTKLCGLEVFTVVLLRTPVFWI
jgi:hypothetical protein